MSDVIGIRYLCTPSDASEAVRIRFGWRLTREDAKAVYAEHRDRRGRIGFVATVQGRIVGYVVVDMGRTHLIVESLGVDRDAPREAVTRRLLGRLRETLSLRRPTLSYPVSEWDVPTQKLLRSCGLRWAATEGGWYVFQCSIGSGSEVAA